MLPEGHVKSACAAATKCAFCLGDIYPGDEMFFWPLRGFFHNICYEESSFHYVNAFLQAQQRNLQTLALKGMKIKASHVSAPREPIQLEMFPKKLINSKIPALWRYRLSVTESYEIFKRTTEELFKSEKEESDLILLQELVWKLEEERERGESFPDGRDLIRECDEWTRDLYKFHRPKEEAERIRASVRLLRRFARSLINLNETERSFLNE